MLRSLFRDSAIYAAADLAVKSTQLVLTPYYVARLSVAEFGYFGLIVAVLALGAAFFNLGFQSGLVRFFHLESERRDELVVSSLTFLALAAVLTVPGVAAVVHFTGVFNGAELRTPFLVALVLASALFGIFVNNGIALLRVGKDPVRSGVLGFSASTSALLAIVFLVEGDALSNLEGIVAGQLIGMIVGVLMTFILLRGYLRGPASVQMFRKVFRYSRPLVVHNGLQWALNNADRLILVRILGPEALGGYFFAYQFGSGLKLVGRSINSSVLHIYSELAAKPAVAPQARAAARGYLGFVFTLMILVGCVAPWVVGLTGWDKFDDYLSLAPLVSAGAATYLLYFLPMNVLSLTLGKSERIYVVTLVAAVVSVGFNLILVPMGVLYAAIVNVASFTVLTGGFLALVRGRTEADAILPGSAVVWTLIGILALGAATSASLMAFI